MEISQTYVQGVAEIIIPGFFETVYMVFYSSLWAILSGIIIGLIIRLTNINGLTPNKFVYTILNTIVNIGRSIPFVIIIMAVFPLSRLIVGVGIGPKAAIVPLTVSAAPFAARVMETAFQTVDDAVYEAAFSCGSTVPQIIRKVIFKESAPELIQGTTLTIIAIIGYSAMAGIIGGGGLGNIAYTYGFQRNQNDILFYTLVILVLMVMVIEVIGKRFANYFDKTH